MTEVTGVEREAEHASTTAIHGPGLARAPSRAGIAASGGAGEAGAAAVRFAGRGESAAVGCTEESAERKGRRERASNSPDRARGQVSQPFVTSDLHPEEALKSC